MHSRGFSSHRRLVIDYKLKQSGHFSWANPPPALPQGSSHSCAAKERRRFDRYFSPSADFSALVWSCVSGQVGGFGSKDDWCGWHSISTNHYKSMYTWIFTETAENFVLGWIHNKKTAVTKARLDVFTSRLNQNSILNLLDCHWIAWNFGDEWIASAVMESFNASIFKMSKFRWDNSVLRHNFQLGSRWFPLQKS